MSERDELLTILSKVLYTNYPKETKDIIKFLLSLTAEISEIITNTNATIDNDFNMVLTAIGESLIVAALNFKTENLDDSDKISVATSI